MSGFLRRLFGTSSTLNMADASQKVQQLIAENNLGMSSNPCPQISDARRISSADHRIVVFSKSYCPYCASTKSLFRSMDAQAAVYELDQMRTSSL